MTQSSKQTQRAGFSVLNLERYLPYRLSILSNKISSKIAETYSDKFALSITEWRIMAVLGEHPDVSADEVSFKTQIEKSILSRAINKLLSRHLIAREFNPSDKRRSMLTLTETGLSVYEEIVPVAYEMEQELLACFNKEDQEQFSVLVDRLYDHAGKLAEN
ncbi:MAG: DNA-binding MarR family transcriptional regulator [Pseudohongiellaceae bacterium]|jgi:DNA-binding MarR family transcriptional regulator